MSKISDMAKKKYLEKIKEYKGTIQSILEKEKKIKMLIQNDSDTANYKRLMLCNETLNLLSYYLLMNELSVTLLGVKNEGYLNEARKTCYKSIIYLEQIVSTYIDIPFSEYEERLNTIENFEDEDRYKLVRKLGFSILSIEEAFGANSKWKWSFVELEGRYTTVAKNLINLKTLTRKLEIGTKGYSERLAHLNLVKFLLIKSADRYREKYELSTQRLDDIQKGINYLSALKRILILLGDNEKLESTKKKIEVWTTKMETDIKMKKIKTYMEKRNT